MSQIAFGTTPHPEDWLSHTARPELNGKRLGVLAHTWFKPEKADQLEPIFGTITDIAVEEPTCLVLDANQSLQDPLHNMMYEEWQDYDEFFETQLKRPYRMAFLRWLMPVMSAPIAAEFYEVLHRDGDFGSGSATVVLSGKIPNAAADEASRLGATYVKALLTDVSCAGASVIRSLNDPTHFVVVERWRDRAEIGCNLEDHPARKDYVSGMAAMTQSGRLNAETFRVHHNPGRFEITN
ncbi:antibiotic biosynthesis monooxygenase [Yoonia sp. SS1-5]|uniref:Quinol monooxygenase n=1 Tax=Yoonia rhodophyticola TaxID=3137370 RepID=A0AAN0M6H6_9RHOB